MSAAFNPDDYVGSGAADSDPVETSGVTEQPDPSIFDRVRDGASSLARYITGIGAPIEFPDLPEITDMSGDQYTFKDNLKSYAAVLAARDDVGKAEIFAQIFKDDPRFGGVFQDNPGLPLIVWNGVPYYVNKPGLSKMDFKEFLAEIAKQAGPTRYAGAAKGLGETVKRGVIGYGGLETGLSAVETQLTPLATAAREDTVLSKTADIGEATAIGVAADVLPDVVRKFPYVGPIVREFMERTEEQLRTGTADVVRKARIEDPQTKLEKVADLATETVAESIETPRPRFEQESKYPLTVGQRTAPLPGGVRPRGTEQLGTEAELRRTMVDESEGIIGFDEAQLNEITDDAMSLAEEFGVGLSRDVSLLDAPEEAAGRIRPIISEVAQAKEAEASRLFKVAEKGPNAPTATAEGVISVIDDILEVPYDAYGMRLNDFLEGTSEVAGEYRSLQRLRKKLSQEKFQDIALKELNAIRKRIGGRLEDVQKPSERRMLTKMKQILDERVFQSIQNGILSGDQEVLDQLRNANELYREYAGLTGKGATKTDVERAANKVLKRIVDSENYTPHMVMSELFGNNLLTGNDAMPLVIRRLRKLLPEDEYTKVEKLLKDAVLIRAFSNIIPLTGDRMVTRRAIVKNYNAIFKGRNKAVVEELFNKDELKKIEKFREDVMPTLWAEIDNNPSGSGWTIMGALARRGLLTPLDALPGVDARKTALEAEKRSLAKDAVRQAFITGNRPLFSASVGAILKPQVIEKGEEKAFPPLPDDIRANMMQQLDDIEQSPAPDEEVFEEDDQPSAQVEMPTFEPLPQTARPTIRPPMPSPTLLGSPENQELAMRRQLQGGIAGLG
tara:strand:+ start:1161 stop:3689 length:2529 start_codon:yes stop_codon:yes gene_type:complete